MFKDDKPVLAIITRNFGSQHVTPFNPPSSQASRRRHIARRRFVRGVRDRQDMQPLEKGITQNLQGVRGLKKGR